MAWAFAKPAPTVTKIAPQPTTGTAKFPAAKPGFTPGGLVLNTPNVILGPGTPQAVQTKVAATPAAAAAPAPASGLPGTNPLDSTALANIAGNQFKTNQSVANLTQQGAYAQTDLQQALAKLAKQQPLDQEKATENYNQQGLLYSGHFGQALGQLGQSYADRSSALQQAATRAAAARQAQISGLGESEKLYEQQQGLGAANRATAAAATDPTAGVDPTLQVLAQALAAQAGTTAPAAAAVKPAAVSAHGVPKVTAGKDSAGNAGAWHTYPDGYRVFVRGGKA